MASESSKNPETPGQPAGRWSRLRGGHFWLLLGIAGGVCVLGAPLVMWSLARGRTPVAKPTERVEDALAALDRGDLDTAQGIAERVVQDESLPRGDQRSARFVLGMVKARSADSSWLRQPQRTRSMAVAHLRVALKQGFPHDREAEGYYALGKNLLLTGYAVEAREPLRAALELSPTRRVELLLLLAQAHQLGVPDLPQAEGYVDRLLETPALTRESRDDALLQKAQIALAAGRLADCRAIVESLAAESTRAADRQVLRGRILLAEARATRDPAHAPRPAEVDQLNQAIDAFRLAQAADRQQQAATAQAMYLIGTALVDLGQNRAAIKQFERTRFLQGSAPEGLAAEAALAELLSREGDDQAALAAWRRTVELASPPEALSSPWLTRESLTLKLLEVHARWLSAEKFEPALELARACYPVVPLARTIELEAETQRRWGQHNLDRGEQAPPAERDELARSGRTLLRRAGRSFEQLAGLDFEQRRYPLHLWAAAECAFTGQSYTRTIELLKRYRKHEARRGQAAALNRMGQAQLALGRYQDAIASFEECITNYPKDNEVYTARIWEAQARLELQQPADAERLLRANLTSDTLTPASREWRETLLALGRLLDGQGRDLEAIDVLEEWTERYPSAPEIHEANYALARVARRQAATLLAESRSDAIEHSALARRREARARLDLALLRYAAVVEALHNVAPAELDDESARLLRNAMFARAATLSDLDRHAEAIEAYTRAGNHSQRRPEVLEAYTRIATAYRRLGQPVEARGALEQARVALARLPADATLTGVTLYDRAGWTSLIDWLKTL